jgi:citrate lyase beta subunit
MKAARSLLAVPATRRKMVEKALASDADAVILDLEDAVAPEGKAAARGDVVSALKELDWHGRPGLYRANALDTSYFYRDLIEVVEEAGDSLDAIMVPKVNRPEDLHAVSMLLSQLELEKGKIKLEAQIESAEGLTNVDSIASATSRLEALHFGPGDFAASVSMPQTSIGAAGVRVLDGPVADYSDEEGLRRSCMIARSLGFDGKWCIHPAQIAVVNETFSPTDREVEWAKKVVAAYEEANATGSGSVSVDGHMVDAASIKLARNTLGKVPENDS